MRRLLHMQSELLLGPWSHADLGPFIVSLITWIGVLGILPCVCWSSLGYGMKHEIAL